MELKKLPLGATGRFVSHDVSIQHLHEKTPEIEFPPRKQFMYVKRFGISSSLKKSNRLELDVH